MRLAIILGLGLFLATSAMAAKNGVVNMQQVILTVKEGKAERAKLEKEIQKKQGEFTKRKTELDEMNKKWQANAALMNADTKMKEQQKFQKKFMALRNDEMTFQQEMKRKEQKATQKIAARVVKIVEEISKSEKFDAVFELSSSGLLYLKDPIDLTSKVVSKFDAGKVAKKKITDSSSKG